MATRKPIGFSDLARFRSEIEACFEVVGPSLDRSLKKDLDHTWDDFSSASPIVSFVGQVKAGKTALTNVVAGFPRLLPSDVNPWTSVVSSLHVNDPFGRQGAEFLFLDQVDWESFRNGDGRMGQIARRAGLTEEADRLRAQVDQIQARARKRLGDNFELLVGKRHHHDSVTTDLLNRYVCFDSAYDEDGSGRYADIVKTASVFVKSEEHDLPLILRDTPGVNDPFLIREQATLASLSETDLCILTLSASQALNMSDIALMKIVLTRDPHDLIIFVNRIDELDDPARQIDEIRHSIEHSFREHGVDASSRIVFGSAIWAEAALCDDFSSLLPHSMKTLQRLATDKGFSVEDGALSLSGIEELRQAIASALMSGPVQRMAKTSLCECRSIIARQRDVVQATLTPPADRASREDVSTAFDDLERRYLLILERAIENHGVQYARAFNEFLEAFANDQCSLLREHMARHGVPDSWEADTIQWRRDLTNQHDKQKDRLTADLAPVRDEVVAKLRQLYADITGHSETDRVVSPDIHDRRPLMAAAATFAIDLPSSTWRRWLGMHQDFEAAVSALKALLSTEARDLYEQIERENILPHCNSLRKTFSELIGEHRKAALGMFQNLRKTENIESMQKRREKLSMIEQNVSSLVDLLDNDANSLSTT